MKVLIRDPIFTSPTGEGTALSCGHLSHLKVQLFAGQRQYLQFFDHLKAHKKIPSLVVHSPITQKVCINCTLTF